LLGTRYYFPIGRVDPIAFPFGIVADYHEYLAVGGDASKAESALSSLFAGVVTQMSNKTYALSIQRFMEMANSPTEHFGKYAGGIAAELVPFSSALQRYTPDPYMREARTIMDGLLKVVWSSGMVPKYNALGVPVMARSDFLSVFNDNPVNREIHRMAGQGYTIPPPSPTTHHADLRDIKMVDGRNAWQVYQELSAQPEPDGRTLTDEVGEVMASEEYKNAPDGYSDDKGSKQSMLHKPVIKYREAAMKILLQDTNVREHVLASQQRVANAYRSKEDQVPIPRIQGTLERIGSAFGQLLTPQEQR
jgi:hypothetical protein